MGICAVGKVLSKQGAGPLRATVHWSNEVSSGVGVQHRSVFFCVVRGLGLWSGSPLPTSGIPYRNVCYSKCEDTGTLMRQCVLPRGEGRPKLLCRRAIRSFLHGLGSSFGLCFTTAS